MTGFFRFRPQGRMPSGTSDRGRRDTSVRVPRPRIALPVLALLLVAGAVLAAAVPDLDPAAVRRWMEESRLLRLFLLPVRTSVYLAVIWYGPVLRGARGADLDRARLALAAFALLLEAAGTLRPLP